jgi:hypothetical protein
MVLVSTLGVC